MENQFPADVQAYLDDVVKRLNGLLKDKLIGVYLFGSASYGAYDPCLSDLDVQAVVKEPLERVDKTAIVRQLNYDALPCPSTKLELVIYARDAVFPASRHPRYELNLNTGPQQADHISFDPADESNHWFLLDIAMGRQLGRPLYGLPLDETFGAIPRLWMLEAIADSLAWHQANEVNSANSVLNACRGWHFIETGDFCSKLSGARWAMQRQSCSDIIEEAIAGRKTGNKLDSARAKALYEMVMKANEIEFRKQSCESTGLATVNQYIIESGECSGFS